MRVILATLLILLSHPIFSQVQEFNLDNGLKVLVKEDHRAPVAVSMVWYNVGSADEAEGITGISHALEHLMFKGTKKYPLGTFSKTFADLGGQINALTNNDYTVFYEKIAAPHLSKSFELEADRMQQLLLDKDEFEKEIKVIQEERRLRVDDNPQSLAFERFLATAHLASPYRHPVIGWMTDLEQMSVQDAKNWYQRYYAPNNATLVVVGDVKPSDVYELAKQYFGKLHSQKRPKRKTFIEPPVLGEKKVQVHAPAQIQMLILGYTVPSVATALPLDAHDPYALEVIAGILDAGDSGRFTNHLTRLKQVASTAGVYYNLYSHHQTQFILYGMPHQDHSLDDLKKSMLEEIELLKTKKITPEELQRVKTQIIAQKTFERDSIFSQAMELGLLQTIGLGWQTAEKYADHINSITPEQIQNTAQHYFNRKAITDARLIPEPRQKEKA